MLLSLIGTNNNNQAGNDDKQTKMALEQTKVAFPTRHQKHYLFFGKNRKLELQDENQQGYLQG
jgi:hypothetical protein